MMKPEMDTKPKSKKEKKKMIVQCKGKRSRTR